MNVKILNVLCEGKTEERFVKEVLKDYLGQKGVVVKYQVLRTNSKKDIRGGLLSYQQVERDLGIWQRGNAGKKNEEHFYTTMFDFYALPNDFPGFEEAGKIMDAYQKIEALEAAFFQDIAQNHFIPYIQLHEYETLVFCGLDFLLEHYPKAEKAVKNLHQVLDKFSGNPEKIDGGSDTAPSKRIANELEGIYNYNKPASGAYVASRVGIAKLRECCRHFDAWMRKLDNI